MASPDTSIERHKELAQRWARIAIEALKGFWREDHYWRDTIEIASGSPQAYYPTATFAVVGTVFRNRLSPADAGLDVSKFVKRLRDDGIDKLIEVSSLSSPTAHWNVYTATTCYSVLAQTLRFINEHPDSGLSGDGVWLEDEAKRLESRLLEQLDTAGSDRLHPFLAWSAIYGLNEGQTARSATASGLSVEQKRRFEATAHANAEKIVAAHAVGGASPADLVALAYCVSILEELAPQKHHRLVEYAINAVCRAQSEGGVWPLGRSVLPASGQALQISSFDIGRTVVRLATKSIANSIASVGSFDVRDEAFARLVVYLSEAFRQVGGCEGWVDDHVFGRDTAESWSTAIAADFLIVYASYAQTRLNDQVLEKYDTKKPRDMVDWIAWEALDDPDPDHSPLTYLAERFLIPLAARSSDLPSKKAKNVSFLLFGPPGTSKTSLVKALANGLGWPLVTITPGLFMAGEGGVNSIDARATAVFADLRKLERVVILFDECDELFRLRPTEALNTDALNLPALITGAMLPRLQDLHDRGRLIFAISTNRIRALDPAVIREGRIDHVVAVGPPELKSRQQLLEKAAEASKLTPSLRLALANATNGRTRDEILRFAQAIAAKAAPVERDISKLVSLSAPNIDPDTLKDFTDDQKMYSRTHVDLL